MSALATLYALSTLAGLAVGALSIISDSHKARRIASYKQQGPRVAALNWED